MGTDLWLCRDQSNSGLKPNESPSAQTQPSQGRGNASPRPEGGEDTRGLADEVMRRCEELLGRWELPWIQAAPALPMRPKAGKCINEREGASHRALQVPPAAGCPLRCVILGIPNLLLGLCPVAVTTSSDSPTCHRATSHRMNVIQPLGAFKGIWLFSQQITACHKLSLLMLCRIPGLEVWEGKKAPEGFHLAAGLAFTGHPG